MLFLTPKKLKRVYFGVAWEWILLFAAAGAIDYFLARDGLDRVLQRFD